MHIAWFLLIFVIVVVVIPLGRAELRLRRRATLEIPEGLAGAELRQTKWETLARLRYLSRPAQRPASYPADAGPHGSGSG
jgi:hypothetical protein